MPADDLSDGTLTDRQPIGWPEGCVAWDQLSHRIPYGPWPLMFGFWPYTAAQVAGIYAAAKVSFSETLMMKIVACGRDYLRAKALTVGVALDRMGADLEDKVAVNYVGNPLPEIERLERALLEMQRAIDGLGLAAIRHLATKKAESMPRPFIGSWTEAQREAWGAKEGQRLETTNASIISALSKARSDVELLKRQCRPSFNNLPLPSKGGHPGKNLEKHVYAHVKSALTAAHKGKPPKHWGTFREACLRPLGIYYEDPKAYSVLEPNSAKPLKNR